MKRVLKTASSEDTQELGSNIGQALRGGEVIELVSDLGGGKTTFTRGVVGGAGSDDLVSSPTFTISNLYQAKDLDIHHFDFYRLSEPGVMEFELEEVAGKPKQVVIVEWSDVVAHVLPKDRLTIHFRSDGDEGRELTIEYPKEMAYLVEKL